MSLEEKEKGFDYEAHERLKKELEGDGAKELEGVETSDANEESILEPGDLPPFWQPTEKGDKRRGELRSVRKTKFNEALRLLTAEGMIAVPVGDAMADVNFEALVGRILTLEFTGFVETKGGNKLRTFRITAAKEAF